MKKYFALLSIIFVLFSSCQSDTSAPDAEQMVMSTLWFQHSAEARALYYQAFNLAKLRVDLAMDTLPADAKLAVITDIDETILDNSPSEGKNILEGERYSSARWKDWTDQQSAKALPGSVSFANYLKDIGVELFYISNRSVEAQKATIANLQAQGFPYADQDHVILKSTQSTKTPRRNRVKETHQILLYLGDNLDDFSDFFEDRSIDNGFQQVDESIIDFGSRFIVFPNPLYGSWTKGVYGSTKDLRPKEVAKKRKTFLSDY